MESWEFGELDTLDDLDVIHMNGRLYDPDSGRFVSADPLVQSFTNTQAFNRYSYVLNGPLSANDPTGFNANNPQDDNQNGGAETVTIQGPRLAGVGIRLQGLGVVGF